MCRDAVRAIERYVERNAAMGESKRLRAKVTSPDLHGMLGVKKSPARWPGWANVDKGGLRRSVGLALLLYLIWKWRLFYVRSVLH